MKKVLSFILILTLVLGSFGTAFAAPADVEGLPCEGAVETLVEAGVISGYSDGSFHPERAITRAEIVKILTTALGYGYLAKSTLADFADTAGHWAEGYAGLGAQMNLVKGYTDNTFRPEKTVTYNEAITFVLRALGYTDAYILADGGSYPDSYIAKAKELGILGDLPTGNIPANRGDVAMLIAQAWEKPRGEVEESVWTANEYEDTMKIRTEVLGELPDPIKMALTRALTYAAGAAAALSGEYADDYVELMKSGEGNYHPDYKRLMNTLETYRDELGAVRLMILYKDNLKDAGAPRSTLDASSSPYTWRRTYLKTDACQASFTGTISADLFAKETRKDGLVWEAYMPFYTTDGTLAGVVCVNAPAPEAEDYPQWVNSSNKWNGKTYDPELLTLITNR
ncbi:MAG: S-layer homology domain-containing protein [Clostridiales bacterium]|nr:S-layer homology domain-containing protein [Clostridiales bacterium]